MSRSGWGLLAASIAAVSTYASGCLRDPKFHGAGGTDPDDPCDHATADITATATPGGGAIVCGPTFSVRFSDQGAHYPSGWWIDGHQILANGRGCADETASGIGLFPAALIDGGDHAPYTDPQRAIIALDGEVIARVRLEWDVPYECGTAKQLTGHSTYTFYPDGRVERYDAVTNHALAVASTCNACPDASTTAGWYLTSYQTFDISDPTTTVQDVDSSHLETYGESTPMNPDLFIDRSRCFTTAGRTIAMAWPDPHNHSRVRIVEDDPATRAAAFTYDITTGEPELASGLQRTVYTTFDMNTHASCDDATARAEAVAATPQLAVVGESTNFAPSPGGIYNGSFEDDKGYMFPDMTLKLTPDSTTIPGGWAMWVDYGHPTGSEYVTIDGTRPAGDAVRVQQTSDTEYIFWFRDALQPGQIAEFGD